ncbi:isochorismatase family protein [Marinobacter confluentis]|uniref:Isochorismatase family protein n=1 Tax=Marinobacter confluentis TaxID=1697557 RepID=A0A4Z1C947_9GAMM|nr:isochorismatase family protein [Marinobacter confluentis]TGN40133.1 isochorismatase family protein [Marinobacter confluentis]
MSLDSRTLAKAERYALIIVDMSLGFTDPARSPLAAECGSVIDANRVLIERFRMAGLPVIFTTVAYSSPEQARVFREKLPDLDVLQSGSGLELIDPRLGRLDKEVLITKHWASGFFGTDLHLQLKSAGADGVIVTGLTTSGCVRATALDCLQHDYRTIVVEEACGDRDMDAHRANLKDLNTKYVDVLSLEATLAHVF